MTINGSPFGTVEQQETHPHSPQILDPNSYKAAEELANNLSKQVVETINDQFKLFLTSSSTHGKTFIRVVNGNTNANEKAMSEAFSTIVETTKELISKAVEQNSNSI